jgi:hypothetical protein
VTRTVLSVRVGLCQSDARAESRQLGKARVTPARSLARSRPGRRARVTGIVTVTARVTGTVSESRRGTARLSGGGRRWHRNQCDGPGATVTARVPPHRPTVCDEPEYQCGAWPGNFSPSHSDTQVQVEDSEPAA